MNNENQPSEEEIRRAYEEDPEDIENIIKFLDYLIASNNFVKVI